MINGVVIEKAEVLFVFVALERADRAGFRGIPKYKTVAIVTNDEQPMFPTVSPLILQRHGFADGAQVGLVVTDPAQNPDGHNTAAIQQTLEVVDHLLERRWLVL